MTSIIWKKTLFFFGVLLITIHIVFFSIAENSFFLFSPLLFIAIIAVISRPKLVGYIFILSTVGFLGIINPEVFMRIPGVFKLSDLLFLLMSFIFFIDVLKHGFILTNDRTFLLLSLIVLSFSLMVLSQFLMTSLRFDLPFVSTLKVGRGFLFILIFFYFTRFFTSKHDQKQLLKFIFFLIFIQATMMFLHIIGLQVTDNTIIRELGTGDNSITRVYLPAYFLASISFFVSTSFLFSKSKEFNHLQLIFVSIISLASIFFSYTRTYWIAIIIGLFVLLILSDRRSQLQMSRYIIIGLFLLLPITLFLSEGFIIDRFLSIFYEIGNDEGNFIYRFTENPQRVDAFLDNPIFGPGFVHSNYAASLFNFIIDEHGLSESQIERALLLQTNDSGLITLLVSFGIIGVIWALYKVVSVFYICLSMPHGPNRSIVNGIVAFIVSIWATCATTYGFTYQDGIVSLALSLYFIWVFSLKTNSA